MIEETQKTHSFNGEYQKSKECYPEILPLLNDYFGSTFKESEEEFDALGSDLNNGKIHLDVKYNHKYYADNFIIEYPQIDHGPGWLFSKDSITDYLVWHCMDKIILIKFKELQAKCIENEAEIRKRFGTMQIRSEGFERTWYKDISKIPMQLIQKHIVKEWDRRTTKNDDSYDLF